MTLSQVKICRPPPLKSDQIFMKDAECAETNEKSIFPFLFSEYGENSSKIDPILNKKMTATRKIKFGRI